MTNKLSDIEVENFEDVQIFAEELDNRANPSLAFSTVGTLGPFMCLSTIGSACTRTES